MNIGAPDQKALRAPSDKRIAIVASKWSDHIVGRLLEGCEARLSEMGTPRDNWRVFRVPGAFELPLAALVAAESGWDAVIALGCVIRGETYHFEAVADGCAGGIRQVALRTRVPVIMGVIMVENEAQAIQRTGGTHGHVGRTSAEAAVEMLLMLGDMRKNAVKGLGGAGGFGETDIPF